ncbi:MAG: primase [Frankiales bacterium]|nr:primase [Frankiales bacterium]
MAGRIRDEDIALVRERSPIAEIVGERLQLRNAGGGELKGLCPFHDEKSPSFHVAPARGFYHCFGCGEGGDVITFLQKVEHLSFSEAVEQLAGKAGIELRYEEGSAALGKEKGQRGRLVAAHIAAAEFYTSQLSSPEAISARRFLAERGFDADTATRYGVGYAPKGWDLLTGHLRGKGFHPDELNTAGLAKPGQRGPIDRFRGRLMWPIADISGDIIGFGARKLYDDDNGPKYLNTPETPLYKKSSVLYGLSLAKSEIAKRQQVVVVEGYTDVMACHLAGVPTAVATCGTSFGEEHIRVLRRLLMDQAEHSGEVIFTFDGDAAGQKAALRAFADEQKFVMQTFVAVTPGGLDPCDLRLAKGDAAVRDLVAGRVPLFEFALRTTIEKFNLETTEGRLAALDAAAPIVGGIRDRGLRQRYAVNLDRWLGFMDETFVLNRVLEHANDTPGGTRRPAAAVVKAAPDPRDAGLLVERETLKLAIQRPAMIGPRFDALDGDVFTAPAYEAVRDAIHAAGGCVASNGTPAGGGAWVAAVAAVADDDITRSLVTELAVEPLLSGNGVDDRYVAEHVARIQELAVTRQIVRIKSRLQRVNPVEQADDYNRLFGELIALEGFKKRLREQGIAGL